MLDAGKGRVGGLVGGTIVHFMPVWRMCAALHLHVLSIVTGSAGAMAGSCCFMHRGVCPAQPHGAYAAMLTSCTLLACNNNTNKYTPVKLTVHRLPCRCPLHRLCSLVWTGPRAVCCLGVQRLLLDRAC